MCKRRIANSTRSQLQQQSSVFDMIFVAQLHAINAASVGGVEDAFIEKQYTECALACLCACLFACW